jgi:hypothetical protein
VNESSRSEYLIVRMRRHDDQGAALGPPVLKAREQCAPFGVRRAFTRRVEWFVCLETNGAIPMIDRPFAV